MNKKTLCVLVMLLAGIFSSSVAFAVFGGDYAQIPHLLRLISENVKRYKQLEKMIDQSENREEYLRLINRGLDNVRGIISTLPVKDGKLLEELKDLKEVTRKLEKIYGAIPEGGETEMLRLHDKSVAESISLINDSKRYAKRQERNSDNILRQAAVASPKGAQRMAAAGNSQILHALSQLIRINGQILKLQSEILASENKRGKDSLEHFNRFNEGMKKSFSGLGRNRQFPRF